MNCLRVKSVFLIFSNLSSSAQTWENFNSRPSVTLNQVKGHLQNHCWTFSDLDSQAALKAQAEEKLSRSFRILDDGIGSNAFVTGSQYTICDIYLAMMTRWSRFQPKPAWHWSNIRRVVAASHARPAFQRMMQKQGIAWAENWPKD